MQSEIHLAYLCRHWLPLRSFYKYKKNLLKVSIPMFHLTKRGLRLTQSWTEADEKWDFKKRTRKWTWKSLRSLQQECSQSLPWPHILLKSRTEKDPWKRLNGAQQGGELCIGSSQVQPPAPCSSCDQGALPAAPWLAAGIWRKWTCKINTQSSWSEGLCHICWH